MKQKTKEKVYNLLVENSGEFLSGQEIADRLFVTRASIWKAIKALQASGYEIDAVTNRGYRIRQAIDGINKEYIEEKLGDYKYIFDLHVFDEVSSTNDEALKLARRDNKNIIVVSDYQTMGRGRRGRQFFSPRGTGVYLSIAIKPSCAIAEMENITAIAAVSLAQAIDCNVFDNENTAGIKWVNDIFVGDKKVAGILTEAFTSFENPDESFIVVGFGINVYMPVDGFPKEISKSAGCLLKGEKKKTLLRSDLIADIILNLGKYLEDEEETVLEEYKKRSFLKGCYVKINSFDGNYKYAYVTGINEKYHLMVKYDDRTEGELSSGEVSVVRY